MFDMETVALLLSPYEQSPPLVTHQATSAVGVVRGAVTITDGEDGGGAQVLSRGAAAAETAPLALLGFGFPLQLETILSLTGRWKTRFISQRFSCFLVLAESHTCFAGILPSSSPLRDRFFVLSVPAVLLPSKAHASDGSSYVSPLVVVFSSKIFKV